MKKSLFESLNKDQKAALSHTDGPILILAGAGSGKTRVLTYKTAHLMTEKKIDGANILMVTFTNKAASEMKDRILKLLSANSQQPTANLPFAGTFHSLCAKILRRDGKHIGVLPNFVIYDEVDKKDAMKTIMNNKNISSKSFNPGSVGGSISGIKNELISPLEYPQYARGYYQETVAEIYIDYQKFLHENGALDFDDLLFETVKLFAKNPDVLSSYQEKFRYVLVDEYQDTNQAQYTLSKLFAGRYRNITVVGDASQSIYAWRGANFRNIVNFKNDFPDVKVFNLEQNYRSTQKILDAAFSVISKNTDHPILKLWTENEKGPSITVYEARDEQDEVNFAIKEMHKIIAEEKNYSYSSFVMLYRTNAQSRTIEEVFLHLGIPYILVGGVRFYERREIKDVISYLRVLVNPKDMVSFKRISKLGKKRLDKFLEFSTEFDISKLTTLEILDKTLEATDYLSLYNKDVEEDLARLENIKEVRSVATEFPAILDFLENISLVEQEYLPQNKPLFSHNKDDRKNAVTLMTLHAVKGLEFPVVFMVGMEEGLFPHARALMDREQLSEERRLCYVGITRAMKKLYITYAARRLYFGQRTSNIVSRFVLDLPSGIVESSLTETDYF
ncbi:hypothetical protein A2773_03915 [Candidatus Gottesmanbacteria bacterium RIFCSPHIGHO2_01_FULL_39_10]|uniref:DNA 3'-5' helicase n=1 Tax=Candidatus Gottesmanbacteria bacterium RIFCSPHIGHO2_01_FULL_39_10 TaxID=1798375 RepID=A0A1F5ZQX9_9BACT|nr:MAG: hypothetical protein A2773_03915 [Candidatus Gottesmanbacteria bacterium RIFCSPHIGHO2_01_FULL_39_10]